MLHLAPCRFPPIVFPCDLIAGLRVCIASIVAVFIVNISGCIDSHVVVVVVSAVFRWVGAHCSVPTEKIACANMCVISVSSMGLAHVGCSECVCAGWAVAGSTGDLVLVIEVVVNCRRA